MNRHFDKTVAMNEFGFMEIEAKPSVEELKAYYAERYYQHDKGAHSHRYGDEEIAFINNKIAQKHRVISQLGLSKARPRLLDVGAGEGWALSYFQAQGWACRGLDFSSHGCESHNPQVLDLLRAGDLFENIDRLIEEGEGFDVIWLDNVLEHVLDPLALVRALGRITLDGGVLVIEVPNDFSLLQRYARDSGLIDREFWVAVPDHLSYFNREGLVNLCAAGGWCVQRVLADFPIDFFLLNDESNYVADGNKGKACHRARVRLDNLFHSIGVDETNALYEKLADMGLGRQIVGFFKRAG